MSEVKFEEEEVYKSKSILGNSITPKSIKFLVEKGIVKNEKKAARLLLGISVFFLALAFYISYTFLFRGSTPRKLSPQEQVQRQQFLDRIKAAKESQTQKQQ